MKESSESQSPATLHGLFGSSVGRRPTGAAGFQPHAPVSADPAPLQRVSQTSVDERDSRASLKGTVAAGLASHFSTPVGDLARSRDSECSLPAGVNPGQRSPNSPTVCCLCWFLGSQLFHGLCALARTRLLKPTDSF